MTFSIAPAVSEKFPDLLIGAIVCKDVHNPSSPPELVAQLREAERRVRASIADPEMLKQHPNIVALQAVHRAFGNNPNKFPPSCQALAKRVIKGGELPSINALVDLYNVVSLNHLLPVGGEDLEKCVGDIRLDLAVGSEPFTSLGETENDPPAPGEVVYQDDAGVICRKMNWREAVRTCLTAATRNAVLVIEAVPPTTRAELQAALEELLAGVRQFTGGNAEIHILDRGHSSLSI